MRSIPIAIILTFLQWIFYSYSLAFEQSERLEPWKQGYLDIHHLSISGDATFFIFPDGTSMLFDAGVRSKEAFDRRAFPLKAAPQRPNNNKRAGEWMAEYIAALLPKKHAKKLDYAVISHFHDDHYGLIDNDSPLSSKGPYKLTGLTDIAETIEIDTIIDRAYPEYDRLAQRKKRRNSDRTFANYTDFMHNRERLGKNNQYFQVGSSEQIGLKYFPKEFPLFSVTNLKANGTIWSGKGNNTSKLFLPKETTGKEGYFNENALSLALKISYGDFDYFTGGDNLGLKGTGVPKWVDSETSIAAVTGEVDALVLNHHGVRDASNEVFLSTLKPRVVIQQSGTSDHPGQEVFYRLKSRDIYQGDRDLFATYIHEETKVTFGPWFVNGYKSTQGHIVIRVYNGGQEYRVFILDDTKPGYSIIDEFGPYRARN